MSLPLTLTLAQKSKCFHNASPFPPLHSTMVKNGTSSISFSRSGVLFGKGVVCTPNSVPGNFSLLLCINGVLLPLIAGFALHLLFSVSIFPDLLARCDKKGSTVSLFPFPDRHDSLQFRFKSPPTKGGKNSKSHLGVKYGTSMMPTEKRKKEKKEPSSGKQKS